MSVKVLSDRDHLGQAALTGLPAPVDPTDAARLVDLQAFATGLQWKQSVRAGTTANGNMATAYANGSVVDGVTLATDDRILIKNQTNPTENGIYVVEVAGVPTRAPDMDSGIEVVGARVVINEGTTLADTTWQCTTNAPVTLGTTDILWSVFGSAGASAGAGLVDNGGAHDVNVGTGIVIVGDAVTLDPVYRKLKFTQNVGDAVSLSYPVTHNLGTQDVSVTCYANSAPFSEVDVEVQHTSTTTVTLEFDSPPLLNAVRVVVMG